jgi:GNAT superfamily N-acetyltransferase
MSMIAPLEGPSPALEALDACAQAEGVRNVGLLLQALREDPVRFRAPGEMMLGFWEGAALVGVGGRSWCPDLDGALRMRRFYVAPSHRRRGIGHDLALVLLRDAGAWCSIVTCNARASPMAPPFWESLGFVRSEIEGVTHALALARDEFTADRSLR